MCTHEALRLITCKSRPNMVKWSERSRQLRDMKTYFNTLSSVKLQPVKSLISKTGYFEQQSVTSTCRDWNMHLYTYLFYTPLFREGADLNSWIQPSCFSVIDGWDEPPNESPMIVRKSTLTTIYSWRAIDKSKYRSKGVTHWRHHRREETLLNTTLFQGNLKN